MAILDKIKYGIDIPRWQQMSPLLNAHAAGGSLCCDKRNGIDAYDAIFQFASASILNIYFCPPNGSAYIANPGVSAFGAGSACVFVPSMTYTGTIAAGATTTSITPSSTIGGTISANGFVLTEGIGYKIRIIDNAAGASGKTEERFIIANTSSTTPTIYLSSALSFTPTAGSAFEIIAGRVFMLGTTAGATQLRRYRVGLADVASAGNTTLTIATESNLVALDEQYVPYDRQSGEGFLVGSSTYDTAGTTKYCLTATNSAAGTLTGQASSGDSGVIANEYRNFQIRIIEDTAIPTAVGQRAIIASHTAGTSPVYTLGSNWSVTPSTNAKYVIELPNTILLFTVAAGTTTYTYNPTGYTINNGTASISSGAFSTTYTAARGTVIAAGAVAIPAWGHEPTTNADGTRITRHSYIYSFRGGSATLDILDISGAAAGSWTNGASYVSQLTSLSTGASGDYAPIDQQGRWGYIAIAGGTSTQMFRFDVKYQSMYPWCSSPAQSGTAAVGNRIAVAPYMTSTGADKMSKVFIQGHTASTLYRSEVII